MSVITASKSLDEVLAVIAEQGGVPVVVLGCDKCAKISKTGGTDEVRSVRDALRSAGVEVCCVDGLVDAVEEGLCDPKAVPARLEPLVEDGRAVQILVLACGAGLKCVRDILPDSPIIPGLDTLGPGVKGELACLACGRCEFGTAGCRMLQVATLQAQRLSSGYAAL